MEILILILLLVLAFVIFAGFIRIVFYLLPFLIVGYGAYYLYLRYVKKDNFKSNHHNVDDRPKRSDDVIDVEFTVHDEKED